jgi:hypothetical protein
MAHHLRAIFSCGGAPASASARRAKPRTSSGEMRPASLSGADTGQSRSMLDPIVGVGGGGLRNIRLQRFFVPRGRRSSG